MDGRTGRRCAAPGCGRFVRAGHSRCARHETVEDEDHSRPLASGVDAEIADFEASVAARRERAERARRFRERLAQGNYRALFDASLSRVIAEAAADRRLVEEIGALRLVLARLLVEEDDLSKLAANVARVASVAVQAARAQRAISGEVAQGLTEALTTILIEMDQD